MRVVQPQTLKRRLCPRLLSPLRCLTLGLLLCASHWALAQTQADDARLKALRPAVSKLLSAAQTSLATGDSATAKAAAARAALRTLAGDAELDALTENERFWLARLRIQALQSLGDARSTTEREALHQALGAALQSQQASAAEHLALSEMLVSALYTAKQYAELEAPAQAYLTAGGAQSRVALMLGHALFLQKKYASAAQVLLQLQTRQSDTKEKPQEIQLKILAFSQRQLKNTNAYAAALDALLLHYPSPAYWADRLNALESRPDFDDALRLDLLRLKQALRLALDAEELQDHVQLALRAGYPLEARQVIEAAQHSAAWGALNAEAAKKWQPLRQQALAAAAAEQGQSATLMREFAKQWGDKKISATALFNSAYGLWLLQPSPAQLLALTQAYEHLDASAAGRSGSAPLKALSGLRLATVYLSAQQQDKAQALLSKFWAVDSTANRSALSELARLWLLAATTGQLPAPK
jgi:hypothetical protein